MYAQNARRRPSAGGGVTGGAISTTTVAPSSADGPPVAPVVRVDVVGRGRNRVRLLTVVCPYGCGTHVHGGGTPDEPPLLGFRGAHCAGRERHPDYRLVLADPEAGR